MHPKIYLSTSSDLSSFAVQKDGSLTSSASPSVSAEVGTRIQEFLIGGDVTFKPLSQTLEAYSVGLTLERAREKVSLQAHTGFSAFTAAYHQRFSENLEIAYRATWKTASNAIGMDLAAKYSLYTGAFFKVYQSISSSFCICFV